MFLEMPETIYFVLSSAALFAVGGLLIRWAFGGKKDNKAKSEKLFETTAFLRSKAPWGMIRPETLFEQKRRKR